jgi:hypothetical protein
MLKYKIYQVVSSRLQVGSSLNPAQGMVLVEGEFSGNNLGYDTIEEAVDAIKNDGDDYVEYTILPSIYMRLG